MYCIYFVLQGILNPTVNCYSCGKSFAEKCRLLVHWEKYHKSSDEGIVQKLRGNADLICAVCHIQVPAADILSHYVGEHKINGLHDYKYLDFDNEGLFKEWKKSIESTTVRRYIETYLKLGKKKKSMKYVCHRSGTFKATGTGVRDIKTQGTKKINGFCPAHIQKKVLGNKIRVCFMRTHVRHENELSHINISPTKKVEIASQLAQKVPKWDILNEIWDLFTAGEINRIHLLMVQDIRNICAKYQLEDHKKDKSDGVSVDIIIIVDEKKSSVLYYKPQDTLDAENPFLKSENFVLILMNDAQVDVLKEFGNDIIAVDGTHGTGYDFTLHTVIILDELHQGFSVASMIPDRKDGMVLKLFFSAIKNKIGWSITLDIFMSDMAEELYNSWVEVMGHPKKRLFSSWHVIKR